MTDEQSIDALLQREPRNIDALVLKGELREQAGDDRAAHAFYQTALRVAAMQPLPQSLHLAVQRAQQGVARGQVRFQQQLERSLAEAGFPTGKRPPRFQQSLDT